MSKATKALLDRLASSIQGALAHALGNLLKDCDINVRVAIRSPGKEDKENDETQKAPSIPFPDRR